MGEGSRTICAVRAPHRAGPKRASAPVGRRLAPRPKGRARRRRQVQTVGTVWPATLKSRWRYVCRSTYRAAVPDWTRRFTPWFGVPLRDVTRAELRTLVDGSVREGVDLDFKAELYGSSDSEKRELAADVAAMANERGGVIILGVTETDGVATALPGVELSECEALRMRQIAGGLLAPHVAFDVLPVEHGRSRDGASTCLRSRPVRGVLTLSARTLTSATPDATVRRSGGWPSRRFPTCTATVSPKRLLRSIACRP